MSLPVVRVFRNPSTNALTLALGCRANAFSATPMGEPGTKASSLARMSPSFVKAGKTLAPMAETRLNPSCRVGFASCTKTESVIRKNGSSASAALLLEFARETRTANGIAWITATAPTMKRACVGREQEQSQAPRPGERRTSSETKNLEYVLGEMKRLADASIGPSLSCSLVAAPGSGQSDATRLNSTSEVGLSTPK